MNHGVGSDGVQTCSTPLWVCMCLENLELPHLTGSRCHPAVCECASMKETFEETGNSNCQQGTQTTNKMGVHCVRVCCRSYSTCFHCPDAVAIAEFKRSQAAKGAHDIWWWDVGHCQLANFTSAICRLGHQVAGDFLSKWPVLLVAIHSQ